MAPLLNQLDDVLVQITSLQLLCTLLLALMLKAHESAAAAAVGVGLDDIDMSGMAHGSSTDDAIMNGLLMAMLIFSYVAGAISFLLSFGSLQEYAMGWLGSLATLGVPLLALVCAVRTKKVKNNTCNKRSYVHPDSIATWEK
jgi:hypothetical protein